MEKACCFVKVMRLHGENSPWDGPCIVRNYIRTLEWKKYFTPEARPEQRHTLHKPLDSEVLHDQRWELKEKNILWWLLIYVWYLYFTLEAVKPTEGFWVKGMIMASFIFGNLFMAWIEEAIETSWDKGGRVLNDLAFSCTYTLHVLFPH